MGSSFQQYYWMNFLLLLVFILIPHASCCFSSIFSFGDSLADTGNLKISSPNETIHFFFPPYGMTYFHLPTGRCSDGRLVIDFIGMHPLTVYLTFTNLSVSQFTLSFSAEYLGLPLVRPYLESQKSIQNFEGGVNFAVAGATALDATFLEEMGDSNPRTNNSLGIQMDWFKEILPYFCNISSSKFGIPSHAYHKENSICIPLQDELILSLANTIFLPYKFRN